MDSTIFAAIIGAGATIVAAVIVIWFGRRKASRADNGKASDGIRDEALKKSTATVPYRQHDLRIFKESDAIMSEKSIESFLSSLEHGHAYRSSQSLMLARFHEFFSYESNQYVSKAIRDLSEKMLNALEELGRFVWDSDLFFDIVTKGDDTKFKLYPSYEIIVRRGVTQELYDKQYNEYANQLYELVEAARSAYKDYRAQIREYYLSE